MIMENEEKKGVKGENEMKGKYLNPKADLTFKLVFGEHKDLAMSLLNALLPLDDDGQIVSLEYATPEMVPDNPGKKDSVVDVRCTDRKGRVFIVEMQMYWNQFFQKRVLLNASKAVVRQLDKREDYRLIQPVYCLSLINDIGFQSGLDEFYHDYAIVNVEHSDRVIEGLRLVFVELPKFKPQTIAERKMAVLWLRYLTEIDESTEEAPAELLENEQTSKALSIVEKSAMTEGQLYAYEKFWDAVISEEALLEGKYAEGMEKGEAKGEAKGKREEKLAIALKMKKDGLPMDVIQKYTGLTAGEIDGL